MHLFKKATK